MNHRYRLATVALHADASSPEEAGSPLAPPIVQSSTFAFPGLPELDRVMSGEVGGYYYSREGNPNAQALAAVVAALEGHPCGVACASGMAALAATVLALAREGDHVVSAREVYGGTRTLLGEELGRLGIGTSFVPGTDADRFEAAVNSHTRLIVCETLSNPTLRLAPIPDLVEVARRRKLHLVLDNTFATPVLLQSASLGVTLTLHSATKYLAGHDDVTAGVVTGTAEQLSRIGRLVARLGASLDPFAAWLALRGLRTLPLRVERQCANAMGLARWLAGHPRVARVHYPGLPEHPQHHLAARLFGGRFGGMLSLELAGGEAAVDRMIRRLRLVRLAPSLGGVSTTVSHPLRSSHRYLPAEELEALGISGALLRVSVGIESLADLVEDFEQALAE